MIRTLLLSAALSAAALTPAAAQFSDPPPDNRSYEFHLTPDELRECMVADYERAQLVDLIAARKEDLDAAQQELLTEQASREDYARVRAHYNAVRANYEDLVFQENTLVEILNNDCRKPYYEVDYAKLKEELGFGWTSRARQGY
jgi:hypothetical protein